ncbi:MAG: zinc-dependent alcohol dehydrogenase [Alkalispirochaeta sp.]
MAMTRRIFEITAPGTGRVVREALALPARGEVLITGEWGAVSPGSEGLVFRGELPEGVGLDDTIEALNGTGATWPIRYGYTLAGRVSHCGSDVDPDWLGRRVFAFHPHATHCVLPVDALIPVADEVPLEHAPLYANTETALTLGWDGEVAFGDAVLVLGAGIVGVLTALVVARSGAGVVVVYDPDETRRTQAAAVFEGTATITVVATLEEADRYLREYPGRYRGRYEGFDVVYELSGRPETLDDAIRRTAFAGRVVVGSWYGRKVAPVSLGERFHRGRIRIVSSQVSTLPPERGARVDYRRRTALVWRLMREIPWNAMPRRIVSLEELPDTMRAIAAGERLPPWIAIDYQRDREQGVSE